MNNRKVGWDFVSWIFTAETGGTSRQKFSKGQPGKECQRQQQVERTAYPTIRDGCMSRPTLLLHNSARVSLVQLRKENS